MPKSDSKTYYWKRGPETLIWLNWNQQIYKNRSITQAKSDDQSKGTIWHV